MNINQLYEKWVAGDETALTALHAQLLNMAYVVIIKQNSSNNDPDLLYDAVADVVIQARDEKPAVGSFSSWAYRALNGTVIDILRSRSANKRAADTVSLDEVDVEDKSQPFVDIDFESKLRHLSAEDRRIADLLLEGYSPNAVARVLDVDHKAVDRRLSVILRIIRGD